uniref:Proteasome subunit beta type-4 n=1 Tax=Vairimorpha necatrix TaxID=6039 RepID=UPI002249A335|nr:Chain J, Proteasome subunit beta type-4 [Vairimorpha necatrix]8ADN_X Chain X, Proteasome subunit beta type-4 [Vairimorpha necatrix]
MESSVALKGNDFVIIGTDSSVKNSYLVLKREEDKFYNINNKVVFTYLGDQGDAFRTSSFINEKLVYEEIQNNVEITPKVTANVIQKTLYDNLRSHPKNCYFLVGGLSQDGPELYSVDLYGSLHENDFMAVGISTYFCYGVLDKEYHKNITKEDGIKIIQKCFDVLKQRCSVDISNIEIKIVSKEGVETINKVL